MCEAMDKAASPLHKKLTRQSAMLKILKLSVTNLTRKNPSWPAGMHVSTLLEYQLIFINPCRSMGGGS